MLHRPESEKAAPAGGGPEFSRKHTLGKGLHCNDTQPTPSLQDLASIRRNIAFSTDKLKALRAAAREAKQIAVDALYDIARAHNLPGLFGEDAVQTALAEGFGYGPKQKEKLDSATH